MRKYPRGQIGLLLLVVLGLVISVVLSIAARSLSDVALSRQGKESKAAFSIAEKGVEEALQLIAGNNVPTGSVTINDASGLVSGEFGVSELNSFELYVKAGDQAEIDLSGVSGALTINWTLVADAKENVACVSEGLGGAPAALELIAVKSDGSIARSYYNGSGCNLSNGFLSSNNQGGSFLSTVSYTPPLLSEKLRLRPFYSGATIRVEGVGLLTQMYLVQSGAKGGDAEKKIKVKRSLESAGSVFDYALFSGSSVVK